MPSGKSKLWLIKTWHHFLHTPILGGAGIFGLKWLFFDKLRAVLMTYHSSISDYFWVRYKFLLQVVTSWIVYVNSIVHKCHFSLVNKIIKLYFKMNVRAYRGSPGAFIDYINSSYIFRENNIIITNIFYFIFLLIFFSLFIIWKVAGWLILIRQNQHNLDER